MREGPDIARIAALVADPARSAMLIALMDGRALTATELAGLGGITKQTASSHLAKLVDGELLIVEAQGRHRYFRLAGSHVGSLLEALMVFSRDAVRPLRTGPRDPALRKARICYDHLAGEMGVRLFERMQGDQWLAEDLTVTERGSTKLTEIGLDLRDFPPSNRPLCRACLDWSQRRQHLAGRLGKAILDHFIARSWAQRLPNSRVISFTAEGERVFNGWLR
ncbi:transcriptional regulator [Haematobacter massiliensis]|uniref:ArsR family transcriptional regulator n=1 Tax=Haematobacter massiliensis TaxID=195105 RepID=A0A086Y6P8_9RHOB|nr:winged helix-turn-helix domain-containing protein [Haematobacter massiliensis]KFI29948.1 ArsR family transcriptional regulator [Haematobacter massiliensis]OWJ69458.1 transcriptional regulator [Haematobacter massiliensis]OWJ86885.1 transcriptional regulator [Haematobacter massiliensis]QBJ25455.1 ArsR family transcriptional regulator [Haematobacter massiliensis]